MLEPYRNNLERIDSPATGLIIASTNCIMTVIALGMIDRVGRRRILLWTIPGMIVGLGIASLSFHYMPLDPLTGDIITSKAPRVWSNILLVSMVLYVASYALGLGNVPWQQSECFPMQVRSVGVTASTACNWGSNLIISMTYLTLMRAITPRFGIPEAERRHRERASSSSSSRWWR